MTLEFSISYQLFVYNFADSGVESSTTYAGHEGATSDGEVQQSFDEDTTSQEGPTPQPSLEDAMQRLGKI